MMSKTQIYKVVLSVFLRYSLSGLVSCSVCDCEDTRRNYPAKYTFHRFPSNPLLREKWLSVIRRVGWTQIRTPLDAANTNTESAWAMLDAFDCGESVTDRIIGGKNAALGQFPWITRLGYQVDDEVDWLCGGVLVSTRHVITAAHCVDFGDYDMELVKIRMGEYDSRKDPDCDGDVCAPAVQDREPRNITVHPSFQSPPFHNDIAVIELNEPVQLHDYVAPICLPRTLEQKTLAEGDFITVAGWGKTNITTEERAHTLQVLSIPVVPPSQCDTFGKQFKVSETEVCAGAQKNKDACGGDSGGPAMKVFDTYDGPKTYLVGVVSFGPTQCGINKPGVYVSVPNFLDWILSVIIK